MRSIIYVILSVLAVSAMAGYQSAYASTDLDSLANIAMQARSQIKIQIDSTDATPEVRALYERGNAETDLLIAAVREGDSDAAKEHFMSAMSIFREITQTFSEPAPVARAAPETEIATLNAPAPAESEVVYRNNIIRSERYIDTLRTAAAKNNFTVDFTRAYGLIQDAKTSLANGNLAQVENALEALRTVQAQIQEEIKEQSAQKSNARVRAFVNGYLTQLDTILAQSTELGLTEDDIARLTQIKDELKSTHDANQLIVKIKHYSVTINIVDYRNQKIQSEVARLEHRMADLQQDADDSIRPKIAEVNQLIVRIKNQTSTDNTLEILALVDSTIKEIEVHVKSKKAAERPIAELAANQTRPAQERAPERDGQEPVRAENQTRQVPEAAAEQQERQALERTEREQTRAEQERQAQQTRQAGAETNPRFAAEIVRLEERIRNLEPHVDGSLESKLDEAKGYLSRLKSQAASNDPTFVRILTLIDSLLDQIEGQIGSQVDQSAAAPSRERTAPPNVGR